MDAQAPDGQKNWLMQYLLKSGQALGEIPRDLQNMGWQGAAVNNYRDRALAGALTGFSGYKAGGLAPSRKPDLDRAKSMADILESGFGNDVATVARNINAGSVPPAAAVPAPHWVNQPRAPNGRFAPIP